MQESAPSSAREPALHARSRDPATYRAAQSGTLPDLVGFEPVGVGDGWFEGRLRVERKLLAPNGFLHAASVIALADTCAGYGTVANLPEGASSFTTIELKSNFIGTARDGVVECRATLAHGGRTTQLWDATVTASGRTIALFRCTQMLLYPR